MLLSQNQPEDDIRQTSSRPRKRRRLDPSTSSQGGPFTDLDDDDEEEDDRAPRDIVLETLTEKFLVQSYEAQPASSTPTASANKENVDAMDVDGPPPANDEDEGDLEMELGVPPPFMPPKPRVRVERRWVISLVVDEEGEERVEKGQVERKEGEGKMVVEVGDDEKAKAAEESAKATADITVTTVPTDVVDKPAPKDAGPSTSSDPQLPTVDGPKPAEPTPSTDAEKKEPIPPVIDVPIENKDKQEPTIPGQPSPLPPPPPDSPSISTTSGSGPSNPPPSKPASSSSTTTAKPKKVAFFDEPKPKDDQTWKKRAKVLQRDLRAGNFDFVEGEVRVLGDVGEDGTRRGWVIEVRRWWYA